MFTIEAIRVSIADSCAFQHVAMQLFVDQSLAMVFIPINTRQQRASLPFKPGVVEMKVTFFSILTFAKPPCNNVLQPEQRSGSDCITLSH